MIGSHLGSVISERERGSAMESVSGEDLRVGSNGSAEPVWRLAWSELRCILGDPCCVVD